MVGIFLFVIAAPYCFNLKLSNRFTNKIIYAMDYILIYQANFIGLASLFDGNKCQNLYSKCTYKFHISCMKKKLTKTN